MSRLWLLYATGQFSQAKHLCENSHTSLEAKSKIVSKFINISSLPDRIVSTFQRPEEQSNSEVWESLKDVFLNPYFSPLVAEDLTGLPKTYVFTGKYEMSKEQGLSGKLVNGCQPRSDNIDAWLCH